MKKNVNIDVENLEVDFPSMIYEENGKWGVKENALTCGLLPIYDSIESPEGYNVFLVRRDGLVGYVLLDENINWIFDLVYTSIQQISTGRFLLCRDGEFFYWREGKKTDWGADEYMLPELAGWICVRRGDEWGYLDGDLRFTNDRKQAHEYVFPEKLFHAKDSRFLQRCDLDRCLDFYLSIKSVHGDKELEKEYAEFVNGLRESGGHSIFMDNGKYGIKDFLGYVVIQPKYDDIAWSSDCIPVAMGYKDGFWNEILVCGRTIRK